LPRQKAAANANYAGKRLDGQRHKLIVQVCGALHDAIAEVCTGRLYSESERKWSFKVVVRASHSHSSGV
jgi:hypothetical protein